METVIWSRHYRCRKLALEAFARGAAAGEGLAPRLLEAACKGERHEREHMEQACGLLNAAVWEYYNYGWPSQLTLVGALASNAATTSWADDPTTPMPATFGHIPGGGLRYGTGRSAIELHIRGAGSLVSVISSEPGDMAIWRGARALGFEHLPAFAAAMREAGLTRLAGLAEEYLCADAYSPDPEVGQ